jgi:hypothetical protein
MRRGVLGALLLVLCVGCRDLPQPQPQPASPVDRSALTYDVLHKPARPVPPPQVVDGVTIDAHGNFAVPGTLPPRYPCHVDADCAVTWQLPGACCRTPCSTHVSAGNRPWVRALEALTDRLCRSFLASQPPKRYPCPRGKCPPGIPHAKCQKGRCTAIFTRS